MDEFDYAWMNVQRQTQTFAGAALLSARISFKAVSFLYRMAKKKLVSARSAENFKDFVTATEGKYQIYNVPVSAEKAEEMYRLNEIGLALQEAKNPAEKNRLTKEQKTIQAGIPELAELKSTGIHCCVLPKVSGNSNTIQVAVAAKDDPVFKNWFVNQLSRKLSGGEKDIRDIETLTEKNYVIFNLPFEGEELDNSLKDFDTLGINYAKLPDLKVGDNNTQVAVPNTDRSRMEFWFQMWKKQKLSAGADESEVGEMYEMDRSSYLNTAGLGEEEYTATADEMYREAEREFEENGIPVPWTAAPGKENSEEYIKFLQDDNYEKISINKETLVDDQQFAGSFERLREDGYFISRIPGTYGEGERTLILPIGQVFSADEGKTFIAFLPKNAPQMVADRMGKVSEWSFGKTYAAYDSVRRGFQKVDELKKVPTQHLPQPPKVPVKSVP